jgi:hypothetical protein
VDLLRAGGAGEEPFPPVQHHRWPEPLRRVGNELQLGAYRWTTAGEGNLFASKREAMVLAERIAHRRLLRGYQVSAFE